MITCLDGKIAGNKEKVAKDLFLNVHSLSTPLLKTKELLCC